MFLKIEFSDKSTIKHFSDHQSQEAKVTVVATLYSIIESSQGAHVRRYVCCPLDSYCSLLLLTWIEYIAVCVLFVLVFVCLPF